MTFCRKSKIEISAIDYSGCCNTAHLYGILSFAKTFTKNEIVITTLDNEVISHIEKEFISFGIQKSKLIRSKNYQNHMLTVTDRKSIDKVLVDFGYSGDELNYRLRTENIRCDNCKSAFIAGCYLTGGTITEPSKSYHLEFTTYRYLFFKDVFKLINDIGFRPKQTNRKNSTRIIYFKDSEQIEDFLAFIGAHNSAMEIMNEKIYKGVVNRVNRQTNCENANIDKILISSEKDRHDIEYIYLTAGKRYLPENLAQIAKLRLEHKELSLADLGQLTDPALSKSGVSHRMHRIRVIADELRKEQMNG